MWEARMPQPAQATGQLPPAAFPDTLLRSVGNTARPESPLRSQEQPYVAPPTTAGHPSNLERGLTDHAGCIVSPPTMDPGQAPRAAPTSWSQAPGTPSAPFQSATHNQRFQNNFQHFQSPKPRDAPHPSHYGQPNPQMPEFQGHNRVQYMGNREAMDKKSESLKKFSGNPGEFVGWANRFMDHMGRVHGDWKNTLEWIKGTNENLSYARL